MTGQVPRASSAEILEGINHVTRELIRLRRWHYLDAVTVLVYAMVCGAQENGVELDWLMHELPGFWQSAREHILREHAADSGIDKAN